MKQEGKLKRMNEGEHFIVRACQDALRLGRALGQVLSPALLSMAALPHKGCSPNLCVRDFSAEGQSSQALSTSDQHLAFLIDQQRGELGHK